MHICIYLYSHTCKYKYIHTYIHTIHTYIHTYIHTNTYNKWNTKNKKTNDINTKNKWNSDGLSFMNKRSTILD